MQHVGIAARHIACTSLKMAGSSPAHLSRHFRPYKAVHAQETLQSAGPGNLVRRVERWSPGVCQPPKVKMNAPSSGKHGAWGQTPLKSTGVASFHGDPQDPDEFHSWQHGSCSRKKGTSDRRHATPTRIDAASNGMARPGAAIKALGAVQHVARGNLHCCIASSKPSLAVLMLVPYRQPTSCGLHRRHVAVVTHYWLVPLAPCTGFQPQKQKTSSTDESPPFKSAFQSCAK